MSWEANQVTEIDAVCGTARSGDVSHLSDVERDQGAHQTGVEYLANLRLLTWVWNS